MYARGFSGLCLLLAFFCISGPEHASAAPLILQNGYAAVVNDPGIFLPTGSPLGPYTAQATGPVGGISFSAGQHPDSPQVLAELHFRLVDLTDGTTVCDTGKRFSFGGTQVSAVMTFYTFDETECAGINDTKLITAGHEYQFSVTGFDNSAWYGYSSRYAYTSYQSAGGTVGSVYFKVDTENIPPFDYSLAAFGPYLHTDGQLEFPTSPEVKSLDAVWTTDPGYVPAFANDNGYACLPFRPCNNMTIDIFTDRLLNGSWGNFNLGSMYASTTSAGYADFYFGTSTLNAGPSNYLYHIRAHISGGVIDSIDGNAGRLPEHANVLFIPGIKGSVLKEGSDTLWPPTTWSNDLPQLELRPDGSSKNPVVVDGILNTFYGAPIYSEFSTFLDTLAEDEVIEAWRALPYDWRYAPEYVVQNGITTSAGTEDVVDVVEKLAGTARNKKVILVTHSTGGLVGKALIKRLEAEGKANLVETFIMVGTPQIGTPQAAAALLHGDDEGIAAGLIVDQADARALSLNLPSAHTLLPAENYFLAVPDPAITFDAGAAYTKPWRDFWGTSINTYQAFSSFITGTGVARTNPGAEDLQTPEILRADLVTGAKRFDEYQIPDQIRAVQVAGWGLPTTKGIRYTMRHEEPAYEPIHTIEGDGTVVYPSAVFADADETYYLNLFSLNRNSSENGKHRNLLSTSPVRQLIESYIKKESAPANTYLQNTKPAITEADDKLIVSTHSPVILGAYDDAGNFTGIDESQDLSAGFLSIREDIPGSSFKTFGENKYVFLPKTGIYSFVVKGIGVGSTTIEVDTLANDQSTKLYTYSDMPFTPSARGTFSFDTASTSYPEISLDLNGDGSVDDRIVPDEAQLTLAELLATFRNKIETLELQKGVKQSLLKKIAKLEKKIAKGKNKKIEKVLALLVRRISQFEKKVKLSEDDATILKELLDQIDSKL